MPNKILIVDDEPGVVVPIQFLMEQQGYLVMIAERGEDALDLIYQNKPDLVILDIMLPGIDGYELCEIIRLNPIDKQINIFYDSSKLDLRLTQKLLLRASLFNSCRPLLNFLLLS
jgi:DNA-binding response OmpR family regulator